MKNSFGQSVILTLFGESHGAEIGAVLDGLAPGIVVEEAYIQEKLRLRRPSGAISTARSEQDDFRIVKVNVDENPDLSARWQVSSIPALFFIKDGQVKNSAVGFYPKPKLMEKMKAL